MRTRLNKQTLDLLESVFAAEINGVANGVGVFQTRKKLAKELEQDGYLVKVTVKLGGRLPVTIEGYRLTLLGNFAYCTSDRCNPEDEVGA